MTTESEADPNIPTSGFSAWLEETRDARRSGAGAAVPCGDCRGCCTSSYFIPIGPDETGTLSRIPRELLFTAPGLPKGHKLLGFRENGHCPMFIDNGCSIYDHRPRTCRDYDCRVFPAAGIAVEEGKPSIARQAARWRFDLVAERDRRHLAAVRAAAKFLLEHAGKFPPGFVPTHPTQQAVLAITVYQAFLPPEAGAGAAGDPRPVGDIVKAVLAAAPARPVLRAKKSGG